MQLHRGTGKALFKKSQCIWGRSQQINREPVFLKTDLCQQRDPHTVWSSTALISTELLCLVGVKNLAQVCVILSLCWCNYHRCAWGRFCLCLLLSFLYGLQPYNALFIPLFFWRLSMLMWRAVFTAGCCYLCESKLVWALMPQAWWQWKHSSPGFATALLPAMGPQDLVCPAQPMLPPHLLLTWFASTYQECVFLPAAQHIEEVGVALRCVSLPAVAHHAILNWFASFVWQQEKPVPMLLLLLILSF